MKTPEEMAEEWVGRNRSYPYDPQKSTDKCVKAAFLAGYKAAENHILNEFFDRYGPIEHAHFAFAVNAYQIEEEK